MDGIAMGAPHTIAMRREILEWQDRHSLDAEVALGRLWSDLRPQIAERLEEISWRSAIANPNAFIRSEIDPILAEKFTPKVQRLIEIARDDLASSVENTLELDHSIEAIEEGEEHLQAATDVLTGLMPLAGGLIMGASLPSLAIASGTAMFGLVATSTISMPLLLGGLALSGAAIATGAVKTSKLHALRTRRMLARIDRHVHYAILSRDTEAERKSVLARLRNAYAEAATLAMEEYS